MKIKEVFSSFWENVKKEFVDVKHFLMSFLMANIIGVVVGAYSAGFGLLVLFVAGLRASNPWILFLLPLGGLSIIGAYKLGKFYKNKGTNQILESISSGENTPLRATPLITFATVVTHLFGGSAGREGAALQIGGSMGEFIGKKMRMDEKTVIVATMCGMSAAFAALFGTPFAATIFALEVVSIGIMHYSALVPCAIASLCGAGVAHFIGLEAEVMPLGEIKVELNILTGLEVVLLAILCAFVSRFFCWLLHTVQHIYEEKIPNPYIRVVVGGILVIAITLLIGNQEFNGASMPSIIKAVEEGDARWYSFLIKMLLTALTLGAGFKGGEIVPTIFVGATFGCVVGPLIGLPAGFAAALGVCAMFCGVTNCPLASIALSFELFGYGAMPFFLLVSAISYRTSGYSGLYHSQRIIYSKSRPEFIFKKKEEKQTVNK